MMHLIRGLFTPRLKAPEAEIDEMAILLDRAAEIAGEEGVDGLVALQRLVLRPIQSHHLRSAYLKPDHAEDRARKLNPWNCFGLTIIPNGLFLCDYLQRNKIPLIDCPPARLSADMVMPTCWHPHSMTIIGSIGAGRKLGKWTQDTNHKLAWWYPLNIYWVGGGNHSIAAGIISGEGEILPREAYDLSALYPLIKFDGLNWRSRDTNEIIGRPLYKEFGYIFEIGRFIVEKTEQQFSTHNL